jgi:DNA-binding NtrC family response regulator
MEGKGQIEMKSSCRILVIDRQSYWLQFSAEVLTAAGFSVSSRATYPDVLSPQIPEGKDADLVVLGCARVGAEEQTLIQQLLARGYHLLVLCAFLPWQDMRALFLQGVDDVADKPRNAPGLISIVETLVASRVLCQQAETEEVFV